MPREKFLQNLRSNRRGAAAGPSGMTSEHLQTLLDDEQCSDLLYEAASAMARAQLPDGIVDAIRKGRLTALRKPSGGVRGIVAGDVLRRLVAKTLAQQYAADFEEACSPFQFALPTRAGTECVAHLFQALTHRSPTTTIVSIDGIGAFDLISRQAMLSGLMRMPNAQRALPFVRMFYGEASEYLWYDDEGRCHSIHQGEGGEQGDPLMPALFALGQHPALVNVRATLREGEALFAFLDDIYVVSEPERAKSIFEEVGRQLQAHCGISVNLGKTRVWNRGGTRPQGFDDIGTADQPAWTGNQDLPQDRQGLMVLGTPLGTRQYVEAQLRHIERDHEQLLERILQMEDLQCAWLLTSMCASPRSSFYLRSLPPSLSQSFAQRHDNRLWETLQALLNNPAETPEEQYVARAMAAFPMRMGGLGLRSAQRLSHAAYWASWADGLEMMHKRCPTIAGHIVTALNGDLLQEDSPLRELQDCRIRIEETGHMVCPTWAELAQGLRPRERIETEPGEWTHGWQFFAADALDTSALISFRSGMHGRRATKTLLRSQSGPCSGRVFTVLPTSSLFTIPPAELRVTMLRRLQLQIPLTSSRCSCRRPLDPHGDHRAACSTCGILKKRSVPLEKATARVCREAGARVAENVFLRDMNVNGISAHDGRRVEVVANGLPLWNGVQLVVDATLVSPVRRDGSPQPGAEEENAVQLDRARARKERTYRELLRSRRCRLVCLGMEVGGRWSQEAYTFVHLLARCKARAKAAIIRKAVQMSFMHRWNSYIGSGLSTCAGCHNA